MERLSQDSRILRKISAVGQGRGEQRKILILRSTIESLASRGIQNTTFDSIARIAKMQRSHVAYYYKTREELITMAIRFVIARAQELTIEHAQKAESPKERLSAIVRAAFRQSEQDPKYAAVISLLWNLATLDPAYRVLHTEVRQMGAERLEHVLELYFREGRKTREEIAFLARTLSAIIFGYLLEAFSTNRYESLEAAGELAHSAVFAFLEHAC